MGELEQRIWDRVRCFSEHPWATHWELGNTGILKIHPLNPPPKQKNMNPLGCMLNLSLAACIFYF